MEEKTENQLLKVPCSRLPELDGLACLLTCSQLCLPQHAEEHQLVSLCSQESSLGGRMLSG